MKTYIKLFCVGLLLMSQSLYAGDNYEGKYEILATPQMTNAPAGMVEVVELFWYTCPHCYKIDEGYLKNWNKNKPEHVYFTHMPAIFGNNDQRIPLAKAYYVAKALKVLDKVHTPLFKAIHDDNRDMNNKESLQKLFAKHGVDEKDFVETYDSFWVDTQIKRAKNLTRGYGIGGVPAVVVNGKYLLTSEMAKGYIEMMKVLDYLIAKEHSAK
ncbi:MAG: thiol:disulfide interchange protein DsbA/DsbL [Candidatus Marithrix sp.]|nr:thiol:disulfide interchange protein DsbA/DsbL [Candidatus Marithrix sp.]